MLFRDITFRLVFNAGNRAKCLSISIYNLVEISIFVRIYDALSNVFANLRSTGCSKNDILFIYYRFSEIIVKMDQMFYRSVDERFQLCVKYEEESSYLNVTLIPCICSISCHAVR